MVSQSAYPRYAMQRAGTVRDASRAAGHLAVWAGLFAVGCVLQFMVLAGAGVRLWPLGVAFLLTVGTYLLDRVGPWPAMPDRADVSSVPDRVRFLRRRVPGVRLVAGLVLVLAVILIWARAPRLALLVPASVLGLIAYAHTPGRWRLKDRLLVKNIAVGSSLTLMAVVLVWSTQPVPQLRGLCSAVLVAVTACAAAILCDLDDAEADARRGTRTVPNTFGAAATWWTAECLVAAVGVGTVLLAWRDIVPWRAAMPVAVAPVLVVAAMHVWRPRHVRDLVDVTFPCAMILAVLVSAPDPILRTREHSPEVRAMTPEHEQGNEDRRGQSRDSARPDLANRLGL